MGRRVLALLIDWLLSYGLALLAVGFGVITKEMLSPEGEGRLQLMLITVEANGNSGDTAYAHAGEDAGTVLEGVLELEVDGEQGLLSPGDSFRFASTLPHRFANPGPARCVVLWAVTPPLY